MGRLQSATKKNRRDATEQRNRKTPGKAGARKRQSGNKREHASGKTQPGKRRRREKRIFYETEKKNPGQQHEAAQSAGTVTTKRRRGTRTDKTTEPEKTGRRNREEATGGAQPAGCMSNRQKSQNPKKATRQRDRKTPEPGNTRKQQIGGLRGATQTVKNRDLGNEAGKTQLAGERRRNYASGVYLKKKRSREDATGHGRPVSSRKQRASVQKNGSVTAT